MGYAQWMQQHATKHKTIVEKLLQKGYTQAQIIEYFEYERMVKNEPDFCPLYAKNKKCHNIEELNCYLCACPNFRFNDEGIQQVQQKKQYSFCSIDSKDGKQGVYGEKIHQNCTACSIPHSKEYISKHFDTSWERLMQQCYYPLKE